MEMEMDLGSVSLEFGFGADARHSDVPVFRRSGFPTFRFSDVPVFRRIRNRNKKPRPNRKCFGGGKNDLRRKEVRWLFAFNVFSPPPRGPLRIPLLRIVDSGNVRVLESQDIFDLLVFRSNTPNPPPPSSFAHRTTNYICQRTLANAFQFLCISQLESFKFST